MKLFILTLALFQVATIIQASVIVPAVAPIITKFATTPIIAPVAPVSTRYHSQDALGQYSFGYSDGLSTKQEIKTLDGVTRGAYSYIDAEGKLQSVEYTADAIRGFRVAGTNLPHPLKPVDIPVVVPEVPELILPRPVEETEDVRLAKVEHLRALEEAKLRLLRPIEIPTIVDPFRPEDLPRPVIDTEEVRRAREEHLRRIEGIRLRNEVFGLRPFEVIRRVDGRDILMNRAEFKDRQCYPICENNPFFCRVECDGIPQKDVYLVSPISAAIPTTVPLWTLLR